MPEKKHLLAEVSLWHIKDIRIIFVLNHTQKKIFFYISTWEDNSLHFRGIYLNLKDISYSHNSSKLFIPFFVYVDVS